MKMDREIELMSSIKFICRNSINSPSRSSLIKQVVRSHVTEDYSHIFNSVTIQAAKDSKVRSICKKLTTLGYI